MRSAQNSDVIAINRGMEPYGKFRPLAFEAGCMKMKQEASGACLVYMTLPAAEDAQVLAEKLVSAGYCAGVNIVGPGHSVYYWHGKLRNAEEWIMFAQVAHERMKEFESALLELHPHIVPCILELGVQSGYQPFMEWIKNPMQDN